MSKERRNREELAAEANRQLEELARAQGRGAVPEGEIHGDTSGVIAVVRAIVDRQADHSDRLDALGRHWLRLATLVAGAASLAACAVVPGLAPYLTPLGAGLIGWAAKFPGRRRRTRRRRS